MHSEKMGETMMNHAPLILLFCLFSLPLSLRTLDAADRVSGWGKVYKLSALNKSAVLNTKGEKLGQVEDLVIDPKRGMIAFAIFSHAGVVGSGQKIKIIPYHFMYFDETGKNFILDTDKEDLTSPLEVKNLRGNKLGEIQDFITESGGRVRFVMLSYEGKMIPVPYSALAVGEKGDSFVLDATREKLASAPAVEEKEESIDQAKATEVYRYFGQTPYWLEEF
jgi:sporulation protein YlmC with PRC-barrel domain